MPRTWTSVLARIGVPTGDGRILSPAGGTSRGLPLPLSWQRKSGDGHEGSEVVARIETLHFSDGMVTATGSMLDSAPYEVEEQIEAGILGPSVDLDDIEYVMDDQERIVLTRWRVAGATLVAIPAFADVSITLDPLPAPSMEDGVEAEAPAYWSAERTAELASFAAAAASSASLTSLPPVDWFQDPQLKQATPLTITSEGRVFGTIAPWGQCHIGLPGCVTPPSSVSGYSYFLVGEQPCEDGTVLPVGTLVAGPRHADAQLAFQAAQQHYDDPGAAVAKVMAGEDEYGIWVAGWMLPGAAQEAVETFRSSPVSGDWRRIGGSLEMIAVCSVNAPGFPVPRARVAFSNGVQRTLIGSFGITPQAGEYAAPATTVDTGARERWIWQQASEEHVWKRTA